MFAAADIAHVDLRGIELPAPFDDPSFDCESSDALTVGSVRRGLEAIAAHAGQEVKDIWNEVRLQAKALLAGQTRKEESVSRERERLVRERLLPDEPSLGKVIRYEGHLHRQLLQTLHELEAIQARRQGLQTPLARVDVQGLPGE